MSKKFTEEQYQKIVEIADEYQSNSAFGIIGDTSQMSIGEEFYETELNEEIDFYENAKEIMAIFNPLTREWAYEQFVEKEKKYRWSGKKIDVNGRHALLYKDRNECIKPLFLYDKFLYDNEEVTEDEQLTESEIKAWGYNPEMFDKEEV